MSRAILVVIFLITLMSCDSNSKGLGIKCKIIDRSIIDSAFFEESLKRASLGDPCSQAIVADLYRTGYGVIENKNEAVKWTVKAAESNVTESKFNLGFYYLKGKYVKKNIGKAIYWFDQAAREGNLSSIINLAVIYSSDKYELYDIEKSIEYYTRASELGSIKAMVSKARILMRLKRDEKEIIKLLNTAIVESDSEAFYLLATCYIKGIGVEKNPRKAVILMSSASEMGHDGARKFLEVLMKK